MLTVISFAPSAGLCQLGRFRTRMEGSGGLALAKMRRAASSGDAGNLIRRVMGRPGLRLALGFFKSVPPVQECASPPIILSPRPFGASDLEDWRRLGTDLIERLAFSCQVRDTPRAIIRREPCVGSSAE